MAQAIASRSTASPTPSQVIRSNQLPRLAHPICRWLSVARHILSLCPTACLLASPILVPNTLRVLRKDATACVLVCPHVQRCAAPPNTPAPGCDVNRKREMRRQYVLAWTRTLPSCSSLLQCPPCDAKSKTPIPCRCRWCHRIYTGAHLGS